MLGIMELFTVIAQVVPLDIINLIVPIIVFAATALVRWGLPQLPGWTIVSVVVPLLSVVAAWVATLVIPESSFFLQVVLGLLAVFVNEILKQFRQVGK